MPSHGEPTFADLCTGLKHLLCGRKGGKHETDDLTRIGTGVKDHDASSEKLRQWQLSQDRNRAGARTTLVDR